MRNNDIAYLLISIDDYKNECRQKLKTLKGLAEVLNNMYAFFESRFNEIERASKDIWRAIEAEEDE